jgi:hypothetical protein
MSNATDQSTKWAREREAQTAALAEIGFGEAFGGGDWMSPHFASCLTCGAVAVIVRDPNVEQPAILHFRWHEKAAR